MSVVIVSTLPRTGTDLCGWSGLCSDLPDDETIGRQWLAVFDLQHDYQPPDEPKIVPFQSHHSQVKLCWSWCWSLERGVVGCQFGFVFLGCIAVWTTDASARGVNSGWRVKCRQNWILWQFFFLDPFPHFYFGVSL